MAISSILQIGKQALLKHQSAIHTTAHNIANVNTDGYTRQRPDFTTFNQAGLNQLAQGLSLDGAVRLRHDFAESQIRYAKQDMGKFETAEQIYTEIEGIFDESSNTGLSSILSEFWDSWSGLASNPESQTARNEVKNRGIILTRAFNQTYSQLDDLHANLKSEIENRVTIANNLIDQIRIVNRQIEFQSNYELMDRRDQLLQQLAEKIPIDVTERSDGGLVVALNGLILASNAETHHIAARFVGAGDNTEAQIYYAESNRQVIINSGELSALIEIHNQTIPEYQNHLDDMAQALTVQTNRIHVSGYNQSGVTGKDFFLSGIDGARDMAVNQEIINNPDYIAASQTENAKGDGTIAQLIADLQNEKIVNGVTVNEAYISLLGDIGNDKQTNTYLRSTQALIIQNLQNQRDAVSSVSLDEEMARLIQYEQGYTAAARIITTVDKMLDDLLALL